MINRIEDNSFAMLTNLEALDLSGNGLLEVPPEIFNLPLLRNLYLADNSFGDRGFETIQKIEKPIKAPLKILSIANNRLYKIPDFGVLPELYMLNLSSNVMRDLTPQQFSPFCNIKEVDLNNTAMEKCRCEEVTRFLFKKRDAYLLSSFYCDAISSGKICATFETKILIKIPSRMQIRHQHDIRGDERLSRLHEHQAGRDRAPESATHVGNHRDWCYRLSGHLHRLPLLPAPT